MPVETIVLLSCTTEKDEKATTARALYAPSAMFREGVGYAERRGWPWAVLSARHGLLLPDEPVKFYDETLKGAPKDVRERWANVVVSQLDMVGWADGSVQLEIHAGANYAHPLVEKLREKGVVVTEPLARLGTGYRRGFYKDDRGGKPLLWRRP